VLIYVCLHLLIAVLLIYLDPNNIPSTSGEWAQLLTLMVFANFLYFKASFTKPGYVDVSSTRPLPKESPELLRAMDVINRFRPAAANRSSGGASANGKSALARFQPASPATSVELQPLARLDAVSDVDSEHDLSPITIHVRPLSDAIGSNSKRGVAETDSSCGAGVDGDRTSASDSLDQLKLAYQTIISDPLFCPWCRILRPPRAKHCTKCARCIIAFDHHW
jgi:hypothetical protein